MTYQSVAPFPLHEIVGHTNQSAISATGFVIDAASEKAALIFQAPKTGTVNKIGFVVAAHTTGATLECEIQTVSASTGFPTGTKVGSSTTGTVATTATGFYEATLSTGASVTKGTLYALVVAQPSAASGNCAIGDLVNHFGSTGQQNFPYGAAYASSWAMASNARRPLIFPGYNDSTYGFVPLNPPVTAVSSTTFNSGSTPDEVGNRFTTVAPLRIAGIRLAVNPAADGRDFTVKLLDSGGSTLATKTIDTGQFGQSAYAWADLYFDASVECPAGTYRITITPTTGSNIVVGWFTMPSATGIRHASPGGVDTYWTERTDGGSWTDTTTRIAQLSPLIDGLDDAAGGGSGLAANPLGGFVR